MTASWGLETYVLEANPSEYERAKSALIKATASKEYNRTYFTQYNAKERAKAQQSWSAHSRKMANRQAAFDA